MTGSSWIQREIFPRYVSIYDDSISYLSRITVLRSFSQLAIDNKGVLSKDLAEQIVDQLLRGLSDKVVNVRMVSARGLEEMIGSLDNGIWNAKVLPALEQRVLEDADEDCKFYAQQAIDSLSA